MGPVRCNMHTGALVPRWGTVAGVPGPRRNADECDAGWFAPVATRRRSLFRCRWHLHRRLAVPPGAALGPQPLPREPRAARPPAAPLREHLRPASTAPTR